MSKHHHWLARQIPQWIEAGIISTAQADALRKRHPMGDSAGLGRLLMTGLAAVMIGLGTILLFAYNWSAMDKVSKLAVVFLFLIATHVAAFSLQRRSHVYSESLFALGTMLMGAGIFLVGQIYHMDSHYPDAFLFWSLGALALAWALPSLTQALMAVALVITWHLTEVFDFRFPNHLALLLVVVGVVPLVWRLHSPLLGRLAGATLLATIGFTVGMVDGHLVVMMLLLSATVLLALEGVLAEANQPQQLAKSLGAPALWVMVVLMYIMSFGDGIPKLVTADLWEGIAGSYLIIALLLGQAGFFWLLWKGRLSVPLRLAELTLLLALMPSLLALSGLADFRSVAHLAALGFNLLLLALSVWLMVDGARCANRYHMVQGSLLFIALAAVRYTDLFDSLIARALVFLLVGISLFALSHFYQRNKRAQQEAGEV